MQAVYNYASPQSILSAVSITNLTQFVGRERSNWLQEVGITIDQNNLAELAIIESGIAFLSDANVRDEILFGLGHDLQTVEKFTNLKLQNNDITKELFALLNLSLDLIPQKSAKQAAISEVSMNKCLYPYQNWMRKKINFFLRDSTARRAIVHMPTGAGKTRTAMEGIIDFVRGLDDSRVSIIWVAHSEELCEQAHEQITALWEKHATEPANIVRLWGGNSSIEIQLDRLTFVVTSFQTVHSMIASNRNDVFTKVANIKKSNALLVVDEAHQSTAETYQSAIEFLTNNRSKILGLTATPGRDYLKGTGEATKALAAFYENNKLDIVDDDGGVLRDPIKFLQDKKVLAQIERIELETNTYVQLSAQEKKTVEKYLEIPDSVLKKLSDDQSRTNLIIAQIMILAIDRGLQTIVFAATKQNAVDLAVLLKLKGCDAAAVIAESKDRAHSIAEFKGGKIKVLTNFGVLTTGFDAPNIGAVVIARPTLSVVLYSQMLGRGLRGELMGGLADCVLLDVVDNLVNMPPASQAFTYFNEFY